MGDRVPRDYARHLAARLAEDSHGQLAGAILHGSAALGGWNAARSDVDILLVVGSEITEMDLRRMSVSLVTMAGDCPGTGLEISIVTVTAAAAPAPPWPYLRHVAGGRSGPVRVAPAPGDAAEDPDLLMHYAVCRAAGISVLGPAPAELVGPVARPAILAYLAGELAWGLVHAPEAYAVLNACRALVYLADGRIVSKIEGGELALAANLAPAALVRRALAQQRGTAPADPPAPDAAAFVRAAAADLAAAAG